MLSFYFMHDQEYFSCSSKENLAVPRTCSKWRDFKVGSTNAANFSQKKRKYSARRLAVLQCATQTMYVWAVAVSLGLSITAGLKMKL
jgi:hypothetical protein